MGFTPNQQPPPEPPTEQTDSHQSIKEIQESLNENEKTISKIRSRIRRWQFEISDQENLSASVKFFRQYTVESDKYRLTYARFQLDEFEIYQEANPEGQGLNPSPHAVYEGSILPGTHSLYVETIYESKPSWFFGRQRPALKVTGKYTFEVLEGEAIYINTICYEEVSAVGNYQKKLKIRFVKE